MFKNLLKISVILTALSLNLSAFAKESEKYIVENISVNVAGDSPADARNLAFVSARRQAFATLLSRLAQDANFINQVSNDEIMQLVRSEQIFDEKIFGSNYVGIFKISFAKDFVDDLFMRKKSALNPEQEASELKFLVIPVKVLQNKMLVWETGNDFRESVQNTISSKGLTNFITAQADIDNLTIINASNVTKLEARDLKPLFDKYKVDVIYITFFSYDDQISKASVLVRGFERMRKFQYRLGFVNSTDLDNVALTQRVGYKMVDYLADLEAKDIRAQGVERDMVQIEVPVRNLSQWIMVKSRIENSGFVSKLDIESISRDVVKISILCDDSLNIDKHFARLGFRLTRRAPNFYILTF